MVPCGWMSYPHRFDRRVVQAFKATHICDVTPGSGGLSLALLMEGEGDKEYHGICHTPEHMQLLKSRLADLVLASMNDESIILCN